MSQFSTPLIKKYLYSGVGWEQRSLTYDDPRKLGDWSLNWLGWRPHTCILQHPHSWQDLFWVHTLLGTESSSLWAEDSSSYRSNGWRHQCWVKRRWRSQMYLQRLWCQWFAQRAVSHSLWRNRGEYQMTVAHTVYQTLFSSHFLKYPAGRIWSCDYRHNLWFGFATQELFYPDLGTVFCVSVSL